MDGDLKLFNITAQNPVVCTLNQLLPLMRNILLCASQGGIPWAKRTRSLLPATTAMLPTRGGGKKWGSKLSPSHTHSFIPVSAPFLLSPPLCPFSTANWRARWKKGVSDDLRKNRNCSWTLPHRLVFMWRTLLRTYFLTWDLNLKN